MPSGGSCTKATVQLSVILIVAQTGTEEGHCRNDICMCAYMYIKKNIYIYTYTIFTYTYTNSTHKVEYGY